MDWSSFTTIVVAASKAALGADQRILRGRQETQRSATLHSYETSRLIPRENLRVARKMDRPAP
jgi:hypothetical protein